MKNPLGLLMERNLLEVFGQKSPELRKRVISEIYADHCVFFEDDQEIVGRDALNAKVGQILQGAPGVVTGMDIAVFERGRIRALYTFIDKAPSD